MVFSYFSQRRNIWNEIEKKKKKKKKHYLIFSPTDGGSEYLQEKRFISGCCASAFLGPQPTPWCNKYFYPHSCNSLCRQCHQHCREWVRFPYCSSVTFWNPPFIQVILSYLFCSLAFSAHRDFFFLYLLLCLVFFQSRWCMISKAIFSFILQYLVCLAYLIQLCLFAMDFVFLIAKYAICHNSCCCFQEPFPF